MCNRRVLADDLCRNFGGGEYNYVN
jgi:hypothetical protein